MRPDYRLLKPGEIPQYGDEFLTEISGTANWIQGPIGGPIPNELANRFRRPAYGPASAGQMIEVLEAEIAFLRQLLARR